MKNIMIIGTMDIGSTIAKAEKNVTVIEDFKTEPVIHITNPYKYTLGGIMTDNTYKTKRNSNFTPKKKKRKK